MKYPYKNYILLTVVKNEEKNILQTINSVIKQTITPSIWFIVDDCSTDNTPLIIKEACKKNKWIISKSLSSSSGHDLGLHLAQIIRDSFVELVDYCKVNQISYNYLANLDGDLILENAFFEKLIIELESSQSVGIVSGHTRYLVNNKLVVDDVNLNEPSGGHMMFKRECFDDCSGIIVSYSWDSVIKAKARLSNWETRRRIDAEVIEVRDVSSAKGYWKGYYYNGKSAYYRNLHPFHIIYKSLRYCFKSPYYIGAAYLAGYVNEVVHLNEKITNPELKQYFRNKYQYSKRKYR